LGTTVFTGDLPADSSDDRPGSPSGSASTTDGATGSTGDSTTGGTSSGDDASGSGDTGPGANDGPYFFIQLADTQFGMFEGNDSFEMETELFEQAVAHINELRPDFVTVCGDLVNQEMNDEQRDEFWRIADTIDPSITLRLVAGNHDVGNTPNPTTLAWYRSSFGPDWYTFTHHTSHFIVLNSTLIRDPEDAESERDAQREWLDDALVEGAGADHIFILQHHPWILEERDEGDGYFNIPWDIREGYLDLFEQHQVTAVFSGHYHRNAHAQANGIEYVITGPVGKPLGDDDSGLRIVKVYPDHIEHEYYEFGDVPTEVNL
jgi:3',5'-cyclic AMP phosphodiesterase CpdA